MIQTENTSMKSSLNPADAALAETSAESEEPQPPDSAYHERFGINAGWVEEVHDQFRVDARSVDESWSIEFGGAASRRTVRDQAPRPSREFEVPLSPSAIPPLATSLRGSFGNGAATAPPIETRQTNREIESLPDGNTVDNAMMLRIADKHARVLRLIHAYRARGHRVARSDPLEGQSTYFPELDPAHYGFGHDNLEEPFVAGDLPGGSVQTLREILARLGKT
jgi:2-oxoglutarate dehydrogenase E1 component